MFDKSHGADFDSGKSQGKCSSNPKLPVGSSPSPSETNHPAQGVGSNSLSIPAAAERARLLSEKIQLLASIHDFEGVIPELRAARSDPGTPAEVVVAALHSRANIAASNQDFAFASSLFAEALGFIDEFTSFRKELACEVLFETATAKMNCASEPGACVHEAVTTLDRAIELAEETGFSSTEQYGSALKRFVGACTAAKQHELAASYLEYEYTYLSQRFGETSAEALLCRLKIIESHLSMGCKEDALGEALELRHKLPEREASHYFTIAIIVEESAADLSLKVGDVRGAFDIADGALQRLVPLTDSESAPGLAELYYTRGRSGWRLGLREPAIADVQKALELERASSNDRPKLRTAMGLWLARKHARQWESTKETAVLEELLTDLSESGNGTGALYRKALVHQMFMFQRERDDPRMKHSAQSLRKHLIQHECSEVEMLQGLQYVSQIWASRGAEDKELAFETLGEALDLLGEGKKDFPSITLELLKNRMYVATAFEDGRIFRRQFMSALKFIQQGEPVKSVVPEAELRLEYAECLRIVGEGHLAAKQLSKVSRLLGASSEQTSSVQVEFLVQRGRAAAEADKSTTALQSFRQAWKIARESNAIATMPLADLCQAYAEALIDKHGVTPAASLLRTAMSMLTKAESLYRAKLIDRLPTYHRILSQILEVQERVPVLSEKRVRAFQERKLRYEKRFGIPGAEAEQELPD